MLELPETMQFVWQYFIELHNSRSSSGYSVNPISYPEILAYATLYQINMADWEVQLIKRLDRVALDAIAEETKKEQAKKL